MRYRYKYLIAYCKTILKYVSETTIADIQKACRDWLSTGRYTLICNPFPSLKPEGTGVNRSKLPELGTQAPSAFPNLQRATLKNGLKVILAQRKGVPTIEGKLIMNAGYATNALSKPGMANLAMDMLDEGTKSLTSLQINEKLQILGASLNAYSDLDASYLNFTTLQQTFDSTLDLFADVLLNPSFPQKEFDRLKKAHLDGIGREKVDPFRIALRIFPKILYGQDHPYGNPINGSGYEASVKSITLDEIRKFYDTWIKPNNATLVIVGDVVMADLVSKLESKIAGWKKGDLPKSSTVPTKSPAGKKIYLVDRPESIQSLIIAAYLTSPYGQVSQTALNAFNSILGGDFVSRLNMNLREDKHWSYGAGSLIWDAKDQRPFLANVSVQNDKTKESIQEIEKEFEGIIKEKPVTTEEFGRVQKNTTLQLPGMWETNNSVAYSLVEMVKFNLKDDYYQTYDSKVRKLTLEEIRQIGQHLVKPELVNWFVVGDKAKIIDGLKQTGYPIIELDGDGNAVK